MKTLYLSLATLLFTFSQICAQQYVPLPLEDGIWVNQVSGSNGSDLPYEYDEAYCSTGTEIEINGLSYIQLNTCYSQDVIGLLRNSENGDKVYIIPEGESEELLLYDFSLEAGESITDIYVPDLGSVDLTVNYIGEETVNGTMRKSIGLLDNSGFEFFWIEGIGSTSGLIYGPSCSTISECSQLTCVSTEGNSIFPNMISGSCLIVDNIELNYKPTTSLAIWPNPSAEVFNLEMTGDSPNSRVSVLDLLGKEVLNFQMGAKEKNCSFSLEGCNPGIYMLIFSSEKGKISRKIIKD
ncbi:MAG: T9SS type A sorting domain-containing protein [Flavobacteriales bacterium]